MTARAPVRTVSISIPPAVDATFMGSPSQLPAANTTFSSSWWSDPAHPEDLAEWLAVRRERDAQLARRRRLQLVGMLVGVAFAHLVLLAELVVPLTALVGIVWWLLG